MKGCAGKPDNYLHILQRIIKFFCGTVEECFNLLAWAVYVSSCINRARPKSATLTMWFSPTRQFRAARSLITEKHSRHYRHDEMELIQLSNLCAGLECFV